MIPFGTYTIPRRVVALAAVLPSAVSAGTMLSSSGNANVSQDAKNSNSTDQSAYSSAKTEQTNIYAPISGRVTSGGVSPTSVS